MDEALWGWGFFALMLFWRLCAKSDCMQVFGCFAPLVQWYTLTGVCLLGFFIRTLLDIVKYDYKATNWLDPALIESNVLDKSLEITPVPEWLRWLSLCAPLVGGAGFLLAMVQCVVLVCRNARVQGDHDVDKRLRWRLHPTLDHLMIIIGVPLVFIVMSTRALIRQWAVMTGSYCWHNEHCVHPTHTRELEAALGSMDMQLATAFQFYAMWEFARLCGFFMSDSRLKWAGDGGDDEAVMREYRKTLKWASVLAVYAFVVIGLANSFFNFGMTLVLKLLPDQIIQESALLHTVETSTSTMFIFATILCIVNMYMISKMLPLRDALGNVTLKFNGTRLMLVVVQIQPQILAALTVESPIFQKVQQLAQDHNIDYLDDWTFSTKQVKLLNISLILGWCFIVAVLNAKFWTVGYQSMSRFVDRAEDNMSHMRAPLLGSGV